MRHELAARIDGWAARHADRPPERNPKAIVLLIVLAFSLGPAAFGHSADATPITYSQQLASVIIVIGCIGCVAGLLMPRSKVGALGVAVEIAGCIILGSGCLLLAIAIGEAALTPLRRALTLGLGFGSWARAVQLALYVRGLVLRNRQGER